MSRYFPFFRMFKIKIIHQIYFIFRPSLSSSFSLPDFLLNFENEGVHFCSRWPGRLPDGQCLLGAVLPGARHSAWWHDPIRQDHWWIWRQLQHLFLGDGSWQACTKVRHFFFVVWQFSAYSQRLNIQAGHVQVTVFTGTRYRSFWLLLNFRLEAYLPDSYDSYRTSVFFYVLWVLSTYS